MPRTIAAILFSIFIFQLSFVNVVHAIYDPLSVPNNKFGIHILDTSELQKAAELVNSGGGEWGYVTIPIRANERDILKWTAFMETAKNLKLIPILRIATYPVGDHWMAPNEWDLIDFSNFLNDLPWPTKNRYVMIYNEPNHQGEWGGFVYPEEYARVLDRSVDIFHKKNENFFVISAGLDAGANENLDYLRKMETYIPGIFKKIDGFGTHAYGNPAFQTPPNPGSPVNIKSYLFEENLIKQFGVESSKIFITEAGWHTGSEHYLDAFQAYWTEENIVAITPFVLGAHAGPFTDFSFTKSDGQFKQFVKDIQQLPKTKGQPQLASQELTVTIKQFANSEQTNYDISNILSKIIKLWIGFLHQK